MERLVNELFHSSGLLVFFLCTLLLSIPFDDIIFSHSPRLVCKMDGN